MYLRFVTTEIDADSRRREGAFHAAYRLLDSPSLDWRTWLAVRRALNWFCRHLTVPRESVFADARAICWYRESAQV